MYLKMYFSLLYVDWISFVYLSSARIAGLDGNYILLSFKILHTAYICHVLETLDYEETIF